MALVATHRRVAYRLLPQTRTNWRWIELTLECKAAHVIVDPVRNTSSTCKECGAVDAASRRTRDDFICIARGHAAHADLNATDSILALALDDSAGRDEASGSGDLHIREAFALATSADPEINAS